MSQRNFRVVPPDRCMRLLESQLIGRVGWAESDLVEILPVTYAVREPDILFRTAQYGLLATLREPQQVTFEVDKFDTDSRSGWSVVAHGHTRSITDSDDLAEYWRSADPVPWAPGVRDLLIAITVDRISGRVVGGV